MKMMKILLPLLAIAALCGCKMMGKETVEPGAPMALTAFSFTHGGMSMEDCWRYSAELTDDGVHLYTEELFLDGEIIDAVIEEPLLEQLGEICGRYRVDLWDGFDKSGKGSDGSRFSLSLTLADGTTISAQGSNKFPERYTEAKNEICALFEGLKDKYSQENR